MSVTTTPVVTIDETINEVTNAYPATLPVFQSFGLDICCGGALTLREAASRHELDVAQLLKAVQDVALEQ